MNVVGQKQSWGIIVNRKILLILKIHKDNKSYMYYLSKKNKLNVILPYINRPFFFCFCQFVEIWFKDFLKNEVEGQSDLYSSRAYALHSTDPGPRVI